jgi:hypothetical protein
MMLSVKIAEREEVAKGDGGSGTLQFECMRGLRVHALRRMICHETGEAPAWQQLLWSGRKLSSTTILNLSAEELVLRLEPPVAAHPGLRGIGAFSMAGTMEVGVSPSDRAQGDALPKARFDDGRIRPWFGSTGMFVKGGSRVLFGSYLQERASWPPVQPPRKQFLEELDLSENADFKFPFKVFVSTIAGLLTKNGIYNTHERNWPVACWHQNYEKIRDMFLDLEKEAADPEFKELVQLPLFIHSGFANKSLIPINGDGPGVAPWGVLQPHEDGFEEQQLFWATAPHSDGPHGWRILAREELFTLQGSTDTHLLKQLLRSAHRLYLDYAPSAE